VRRVALFLLVLSVAACGLRPAPKPAEVPRAINKLTLVAQYSIPPLGRFPPGIGLPFGGVSGLTTRRAGTELFGISDAQHGGRVYRFAVDGEGASFRVTPTNIIPLEGLPGRDYADNESMVFLADGTMVTCSEGTVAQPRVPPALTQYGRDGNFIRTLPLRDRFVPEPTGQQTKGARGSAGVESVTLAPDGKRLFAGVETALVQDGELASFTAGTDTRVLEYVPRRDTFEPAREFVYRLEPLLKPSYDPGVFMINGLVDLLAVDRTSLLALERGYVEEKSRPGRGLNQIRIYRVTLAGATDVSALDSIKGHSEIVPVTKTLLLDLAQTPGLSAELAQSLDNFEGMAFGPRLPDGRATLLLVSDDNFNAAQRTWFLLFAIE
jgi:Esterase-like activity of phytase